VAPTTDGARRADARSVGSCLDVLAGVDSDRPAAHRAGPRGRTWRSGRGRSRRSRLQDDSRPSPAERR